MHSPVESHPVMGYPIFQGFSPLAQGGLNPLLHLPSSWNSRLLVDLTGVLMTTTSPPGATCIPRKGGVVIDPGIGEATIRVPVAYRENNRPQVFYKF